MHLKCVICSDLLTPSQEIDCTRCGHLFHYPCLTQWMERSKTCPQCRNKVTDSTRYRVYLSVEDNGEHVDSATLENHLDNLQFQMRLKDKDIENVKEKYKVAKVQNSGLRDEIKTQEKRVRVLESAMHALKEQLLFFKAKSKDVEKLEQKIESLKQKVKDLENVELVISGSRGQVNDMLRNNRDPQSLTILVSTLKKELTDSDRSKKHTQTMLKESQSELLQYKRQLGELAKQNDKLKHEVKAHKNCEFERQYLKKKIQDLHKARPETDSPSGANTSTRRVMAESPAPLQQIIDLSEDVTPGKHVSPSMPERVLAIKEAQDPHLRVQSSSVGLSGLMNYNSNFQLKAPVLNIKPKFSFFKQQMTKVEHSKNQPQHMSYDGLGGHSREEQFPTPQPVRIGIKRPRSTTVTSAKFRRLAPAPHKNANVNKFPDSPSQSE